jgi:membrane protein DedA with SNARE-associated domain
LILVANLLNSYISTVLSFLICTQPKWAGSTKKVKATSGNMEGILLLLGEIDCLLGQWMQDLALQFGYFGVFAISFIGSVSVIFPIPYTVAIFFVGSFLDPFLVAISGGLGSALGEFSGYGLGYCGRKIVNEKTQKKMDYMVKFFDRHGPLAIFLFALTPLPDDLLFIPLGVMHYPFWRAFIPALLGKMLMTYALAYSGQQSIDFIMTLFGESGWIGAIITTVLLIVVIFAMIKLDWEKIFEKYVGKKDDEQSQDAAAKE